MYDELTTQDILDMQNEIKERQQLRSGFHDDIVMARSYGDLSENSEYVAAKDEQSATENEITELDEKLKKAKVISGKIDVSIKDAAFHGSGQKVSYDSFRTKSLSQSGF